MPENQPTPEAQEMLPKASNAVARLYVADRFSAMLGEQTTEQRDEHWNQRTQEFPAFSDKIRELRERMKVVYEAKKGYPPQVIGALRMPFNSVQDDLAQEFLGDVLLSRMATNSGNIDSKVDSDYESQAMSGEMGLLEGWRSAQAKGVTAERAVGSVLQGKLRVAYQPKQGA